MASLDPCLLLLLENEILTVKFQVQYHSTDWVRDVGGSWAGKILESSHSSAWHYRWNRAEEKIQTDSNWTTLSVQMEKMEITNCLVHSIQQVKILSTFNEQSWFFNFCFKINKWKQKYLKSRWTRLGHLPTKVETSREKKKKRWSLLNEEQDKDICYQHYHLSWC